ncbi:hypothetical protein CBS101457_003915 [Exobasidium rhododendri]|nr:hypothetical protein CBS101457_003915 [Exobasidium rhododendri]
MPSTGGSLGGISVPVAIVLGLISSFIQSLGLTIQRKSHIQNASLPDTRQRSEWKRPLWLIGFAIFIVANIGGTVFQIGALPIVMLAPLGAVSLLYNALLARFILDDFFSRYMIAGTALIAAGAVLIGYFGVVREPNHSLDDLLALYSRPTFIAFASVFALTFVGVLAIAHLAEWQLHIRLFRPETASVKGKSRRIGRKKPKRRWSAPSLAPVVEVSESNSGIATPVLEIADEAARKGISIERVLAKRNGLQSLSRTAGMGAGPRGYGTFYKSHDSSSSSASSTTSEESTVIASAKPSQSTSAAAAAAAMNDPAIRRTCLSLAVAYGGASGTLSGACLLFAKSGIELLVMTIDGENQFDRWQSWFLIAVMLIAALSQLWYLNKSLRLADPTLVCPLAFCFYNTSSIMLGLVYFNQLGSLSWTSLVLVIVGIAVLLAGVWTVSLHGSKVAEDGDDKEEEEGLLAQDQSRLSSLDSSASVLSPVEADNATEQTSLLANAGGIGGPHLPPSSAARKSPELSNLGLASSPMSPDGSNSSSSSGGSSGGGGNSSLTRSKRKSRSGSFGGLGMRVPGLPLHSVHFESSEGSSEAPLEPIDTSTRNGSSNIVAGALTSPRSQQRRRHIYEALLEGGLSIGISPSSPGFHVKHTFEMNNDDSTFSAMQKQRRPRRTFSEADVEILAADQDAQVGDLPLESEQEDYNSAWTRVMPALDYTTLSDRLSNLTTSTKGWFGGMFQNNSRSDG